MANHVFNIKIETFHAGLGQNFGQVEFDVVAKDGFEAFSKVKAKVKPIKDTKVQGGRVYKLKYVRLMSINRTCTLD